MNSLAKLVTALALVSTPGVSQDTSSTNLIPKVSAAACKAVQSKPEKDGTCGFFGADSYFYIAKPQPNGSCNLEIASPVTGFKQYTDTSCDQLLQDLALVRKTNKTK